MISLLISILFLTKSCFCQELQQLQQFHPNSGHSSKSDSYSSKTTDLIERHLLPKRMQTLLQELSKNCSKELEQQLADNHVCLQEYRELVSSNTKSDSNIYDEYNYHVGCCHVWTFDECVLSLVRMRARTSFDSCTELDVYNAQQLMDSSSSDALFHHLCPSHHRNSRFCADTEPPTQMWLLVLLWVVGGTAIFLALSGAICMLVLFVTSGRNGNRPKIFIVNSEATKSLIDNMEVNLEP